MTEYNIILKTPNVAPLPVSLDCIALEDHTIIIIRGSEGLYIELHGYSRYLYPLLLKFARVANPNANYGQKVRELSVEQVVAYFESSPVLSYMADDVRSALLPAGAGQVDQLQLDVAKCRHLVRPNLADLAEVIYGKRYYSGKQPGYLKQVQAALQATTEDGQIGEAA